MTDEEGRGVINYFDASGKECTSRTGGCELVSREKKGEWKADIKYMDD